MSGSNTALLRLFPERTGATASECLPLSGYFSCQAWNNYRPFPAECQPFAMQGCFRFRECGEEEIRRGVGLLSRTRREERSTETRRGAGLILNAEKAERQRRRGFQKHFVPLSSGCSVFCAAGVGAGPFFVIDCKKVR
jgi:hypothetical protein